MCLSSFGNLAQRAAVSKAWRCAGGRGDGRGAASRAPFLRSPSAACSRLRGSAETVLHEIWRPEEKQQPHRFFNLEGRSGVTHVGVALLGAVSPLATPPPGVRSASLGPGVPLTFMTKCTSFSGRMSAPSRLEVERNTWERLVHPHGARPGLTSPSTPSPLPVLPSSSGRSSSHSRG